MKSGKIQNLGWNKQSLNMDKLYKNITFTLQYNNQKNQIFCKTNRLNSSKVSISYT